MKATPMPSVDGMTFKAAGVVLIIAAGRVIPGVEVTLQCSYNSGKNREKLQVVQGGLAGLQERAMCIRRQIILARGDSPNAKEKELQRLHQFQSQRHTCQVSQAQLGPKMKC
jgi:hypothetical protein